MNVQTSRSAARRREKTRAPEAKLLRVSPNADAALSRLDAAGITYVQEGDHYRVAETFLLWAYTSYWRKEDKSQHGYTVALLIAAVGNG